MGSFQRKKHVLLYIFCGICISFVIITGNLFLSSQKKEQTVCGGTIKNYLVQWNSMSPLIEDGSTVKASIDYYTCNWNSPHRGDIVILEDSAVVWPYIKTIWAIPWDTISITEKGTLFIENKELRNTYWEIYFFTQNELNFMSIYIRDGKLQSDAYLVFWENIHNSRDSRKIWAISKSAFKAKVIEVNEIPITQ